MKAMDLLVVACVAAGLVLGALAWLLAGIPRSAIAVGAMVGLVAGCVVAAVPPGAAMVRRLSSLPRRRG